MKDTVFGIPRNPADRYPTGPRDVRFDDDFQTLV
jgi:hypothetical protein